MGFWSNLKKVGSIASLIPGVNTVAAPLTGLMYGIDAGRSLAKGDWKGTLGNTLGAIPGLSKAGKFPGIGSRLGGIGSSLGGLGKSIRGIPGLSQLGSLGGDVAGLYNRIPGWAKDVGVASAAELLSSYGNRGGGSPSGVPLNITGPTQGRLRSLSGRQFAEGGGVLPQRNLPSPPSTGDPTRDIAGLSELIRLLSPRAKEALIEIPMMDSENPSLSLPEAIEYSPLAPLMYTQEPTPDPIYDIIRSNVEKGISYQHSDGEWRPYPEKFPEMAEGGWVSPQSNGEGVLTMLGDTPSGEEIVIPADKYLAYMENGGGVTPLTSDDSPRHPSKWLESRMTLEDAFEDVVPWRDPILAQLEGYSPEEIATGRTFEGANSGWAAADPLELLYPRWNPFAFNADSPSEEEPPPTWWDKYGAYVGWGGLGLGTAIDFLFRPDNQQFSREYLASERPDRGLAPTLSGEPRVPVIPGAQDGTFINTQNPLLALVAEAGRSKGPLLGSEYVGSPSAVERDLGLSRQEIPMVLGEEPFRFQAGGGLMNNPAAINYRSNTGYGHDPGKEDIWAQQNVPGYSDALSTSYGYGTIDPSASGATLMSTGANRTQYGLRSTGVERAGTGQAMAEHRGLTSGKTSNYTNPIVRPDPLDPEVDTKKAIDDGIDHSWNLRRLNSLAAEQSAAGGNIWGDRATQNYNRMMKDYSLAIDQNERDRYMADLYGWQAQDASDLAWQGLGMDAAAGRGPGLGQTIAGLAGDYLESRRRKSTLEELLS